MRPNAFTCAIALALCAGLVASCGKNADRDMAKDLSRATPPPQPTTAAPANTPANIGQPSHSEKQEGANPQQGQVDPKESKQHKDFQRDGDPAGPSKDAKPSS
jgi:hypothetical protein